MAQVTQQSRVALFVPTMHCGGAERMMLNLLRGMQQQGIPLDLLLSRAEGALLRELPHDVRVVDFRAPRVRQSLARLAGYLRTEQPYALFSRMSHANVTALAARKLSGTQVKIGVIEACNFSAQPATFALRRLLLPAMRWLYPSADAVIAVSNGVARDLERLVRMRAGRVQTIYNPVVDERLPALASAPAPHRWLEEHVPVVLGVGRLALQKDFATLIRAFARVRQQRAARLLIFGEGEERRALEELVRSLRLGADVCLPGVCANPLAAMSRASLFVLSSRFEGLPNVLIEALACGCPAISTDCPSGPEEILERGRYGALVPVGDSVRLAGAMLAALAQPAARATLRARGGEFSLDRALPRYLAAIDYPGYQQTIRRAA